MTDSQGNELRDYLNIIRQHHFKIVLAFLLTAGTATGISFYLSPTYEAATLLEIQGSAQSTSLSTNLFQSVLSGRMGSVELETLVRRFTTESLLNATLDSLEMESNPGVQHLPPPGWLRAHISARVLPETSYISVSLRLPEAYGGERNAALFVNRLVRTLQEWRALADSQKATSRKSIVEKRMQELHSELAQLQHQLLDFMQEKGSPATWYPILTNLLERQQELIAGMSSAQARLDIAIENKQRADQRLADQPEFEKTSEAVGVDSIWSGLQTQLFAVEAEIAEAGEKYGSESPQLRGLQQKRDTVQEQLRHRVQTVSRTTTHALSPRYLTLLEQQWSYESQIVGFRQQKKALRGEFDQLEQELGQLLQSLPGQQYDFDLLKRQIESLYSGLIELQKQSIEAEILLAEAEPPLQVGPYRAKGGIIIIDAAIPKRAAVSPDRRFIVMLGILVGLGSGFVWAIGAEVVGRHRAGSLETAGNILPKNS